MSSTILWNWGSLATATIQNAKERLRMSRPTTGMRSNVNGGANESVGAMRRLTKKAAMSW